MPNSPRLANSLASPGGRTPCSNHSPISGSTRRRTNSRTVSRIARSSSSSSASTLRKSRGSIAGGLAVVVTTRSYLALIRDPRAHEPAVALDHRLVLMLGEGRPHDLDQERIELRSLEPLERTRVEVHERLGTELLVQIDLEEGVDERAVLGELLVVRQLVAVADREIVPRVLVD